MTEVIGAALTHSIHSLQGRASNYGRPSLHGETSLLPFVCVLAIEYFATAQGARLRREEELETATVPLVALSSV